MTLMLVLALAKGSSSLIRISKLLMADTCYMPIACQELLDFDLQKGDLLLNL